MNDDDQLAKHPQNGPHAATQGAHTERQSSIASWPVSLVRKCVFATVGFEAKFGQSSPSLVAALIEEQARCTDHSNTKAIDLQKVLVPPSPPLKCTISPPPETPPMPETMQGWGFLDFKRLMPRYA